MKRIIIPTILLLLAAGVPEEGWAQNVVGSPKCTICERTDCEYGAKHPTYIKVNGTTMLTLQVENAATKKEILVTTDDSKQWTVRSNSSWCRVSRTDKTTIRITVSENTATKSRTATVTVVTSDKRKTATITVTQAAAPQPPASKPKPPTSNSNSKPPTSNSQTTTSVTHTLSINGNASSEVAIEVESSSAIKRYFSVSTNAASYSVTALPTWAKVTGKTSYGFTLEIDANTTAAKRSDWFRVQTDPQGKAKTKSIKVNITQAGRETYLKVGGYTSTFTINCNYATSCKGTYKVETNAASYTITYLPTWVTVTEKKDDHFIVRFAPNSGGERTDWFMVTAGDKSLRINVKQVAATAESSSTASSAGSSSSSSSSSSTGASRKEHRGPFWNWELEDYHYGFTFAGYSNYRLHWQSDSDPDDNYRGDDIWGNNGSRIHGAQFGFHFQIFPRWWFGIGLYTGAMFDLFYTFNDPDDWPDYPSSIGYSYTSHREYAATIPLHLFLRLPVSFIDDVALWAHAGPDISYSWGGRYYDSRDDNRGVELAYGDGLHRSHFNISYSFALGLQIDQFLIEAGMTHGLSKHNMDDFFETPGDATLHQFSLRLSYLFNFTKPNYY